MSPYSGHADPHGAAATRTLAGLTVTKVSVGPMDNNAYLLECAATGELCLVDAAEEPERLLELLAGRSPALVVTTHRHADHWQALGAVVGATGARTAAGRDDVDGLPVAVDDPLDHGDEVLFGQVRLGVVGLVGHTPGSVALRYDEPGAAPHLFTGDSLFPGGPGRTGSAPDFTRLMDDLEERVFGPLPDATWVYPGHGDDTTLGAERPSLPAWRARGW